MSLLWRWRCGHPGAGAGLVEGERMPYTAVLRKEVEKSIMAAVAEKSYASARVPGSSETVMPRRHPETEKLGPHGRRSGMRSVHDRAGEPAELNPELRD